jgi:hypothetical protein
MEVRIYTIAGEPVTRLSGAGGTVVWRIPRRLAGGFYLCRVTSRDASGDVSKRVLKLIVAR